MSELERSCCLCDERISGCFGYVVAGDFLEFIKGRRDKVDVRELCAKEVLRYDYETLVSLLHSEGRTYLSNESSKV